MAQTVQRAPVRAEEGPAGCSCRRGGPHSAGPFERDDQRAHRSPRVHCMSAASNGGSLPAEWPPATRRAERHTPGDRRAAVDAACQRPSHQTPATDLRASVSCTTRRPIARANGRRSCQRY